MGFRGMLANLRNETTGVQQKSMDRELKVKVGGHIYTASDFEEQEMSLDKVRTPVNTSVRVMFFKPGCQICPKWIHPITKINQVIPNRKRISIIDVNSYDPRLKWLQPGGTPQVFLDGLVIQGATTQGSSLAFLKEFLKDEIKYDVKVRRK